MRSWTSTQSDQELFAAVLVAVCWSATVSHSVPVERGRAMSWRTLSTHTRRATDSSHVRALERPANVGSADMMRR